MKSATFLQNNEKSTTWDLDREALGKRIVDCLKRLKMKKGVFAQKLGRDKTRISKYLKGEDLTIEMLGQIAMVLECSTDWLLGFPTQPQERSGRKNSVMPAEFLQQTEIKSAASQEDKRIRNLISKFREQASLSTKRHLATHIDFLLKVKVDE